MHLEMNKFSLKWKSNILFCQLCRHTFLDCWADPFIPSKKSKTMQQTQKLTTSKTIRFQFEWTVQSGYFGAVNLLALRSNVEHRAPVTHMCSKCETCDVDWWNEWLCLGAWPLRRLNTIQSVQITAGLDQVYSSHYSVSFGPDLSEPQHDPAPLITHTTRWNTIKQACRESQVPN